MEDLFLQILEIQQKLKQKCKTSSNPTIRQTFKSGYVSFDKTDQFDIENDPPYIELQKMYDDIISSFFYDDDILAKIALDLSADLYNDTCELLVKEEFDSLNKLYTAYLLTPVFKKKIKRYMPNNPKIKKLISLIDNKSENYNKMLLSILLFLHFKKNNTNTFIDNKFIKTEYYKSIYGELPTYRNGIPSQLTDIKLHLLNDLISNKSVLEKLLRLSDLLRIVYNEYIKSSEPKTFTEDSFNAFDVELKKEEPIDYALIKLFFDQKELTVITVMLQIKLNGNEKLKQLWDSIRTP